VFHSILTYTVLGRVHSLLYSKFYQECHLVLALSFSFTFSCLLGHQIAGNVVYLLQSTAVLTEFSNFLMLGVFEGVSFYGQKFWHHQYNNFFCFKLCNIFYIQKFPGNLGTLCCFFHSMGYGIFI